MLSTGFEKVAKAKLRSKSPKQPSDETPENKEFSKQPLSGPDVRASDIGPYYTVGNVNV